MKQELFYQNLPSVRNFYELTRFQDYQKIPGDWLVVAADVENSTQAISQGKYKEVNALGVSVLTAVLNIFKDIPIPFAFSGDGAALCVPPLRTEAVKSALSFCRQMGKELYGFELRVGLVPLEEIRARGTDVRVLKYQISEFCSQALFSGGGLAYADTCLKDPLQPYALTFQEKAEADFSGFECRWKNIPSRHGETIAWLIQAVDENGRSALLDTVLQKMRSIYKEEQSHPLDVRKMQLSLNLFQLRAEIRNRTYRKSAAAKKIYALQIGLENLLGKILMGLGIKTKEIAWGRYKQQTVLNADYRKYDDMVRMVLAGNREQRERFAAFLEPLRAEGKIVYGFHVSDSALMTCLVRDRSGEHYHFVDGSEGGYALAAKMLKEMSSAVK